MFTSKTLPITFTENMQHPIYRYMKLYTFLFIFILSLNVFGDGINTDTVSNSGFNQLSEVDKAAIISDIAKKVAVKNAAPEVPTIEKLDGWVDLGTKIGKGLSGAAKETGVAVNDFAKTPVGILTTGLIVWKMIGNTIFHFIAAILVWSIGLPLLHLLWKRYLTTETYDKEGKLVQKEVETMSGDAFIGYVVCNVVIFISGIVIMMTW